MGRPSVSRIRPHLHRRLGGLATILALVGGCGRSVDPSRDLAPLPGPDLGGGGSGCGDFDSSCESISFGPRVGRPFPFQSDKPPDPSASADRLGRDANGYLSLDQRKAAGNFLWVANSNDLNRGTVSKLDATTIRETARYFSVTCFSTMNGSKSPCDGRRGCCAADSYPQWQNRKGKLLSGPYQQINQMSNAPSRTAVDFNGDMWVANRCFGCQSSVTKIANDLSACIDRNKNGKVDTSSDVNGDGVIQWDCNGDGAPDDLDTVKARPCTSGMKQEFYGSDDECILFTTNTGVPNNLGRPLTLGPGPEPAAPSDAWAGLHGSGEFFRIDGTTGLTKDRLQLPEASCRPYGAVIDATGILWAGNSSGSPRPVLCWGDTKDTVQVGVTRSPSVGQLQGYGIALDRDQNIWQGCLAFGACRYTPDRFAVPRTLGEGSWTMFSRPGANSGGGHGVGVAVDNRSTNTYFAWITGNEHIARIPASKEPPPPPFVDRLVDGSAYPTARIAGDGRGVGVDDDQNLWNVASSGAAGVTRVRVDPNGTITQPDIKSPAIGNRLCPAGDRCAHKGDSPSEPAPYTYSEFTGFGLRNFIGTRGSWTYVVRGCGGSGAPQPTRWMLLKWEADIPPGTAVSVRARTGPTAAPNSTWSPWSASFHTSPADLSVGLALPRNNKEKGYLQVEVNLANNAKDKTPKVKVVQVFWKCG